MCSICETALVAAQVRALLLVDSASIVALNAALLADDIGVGGSSLAASIAIGSNIIFALCVITLVVLLCGFGWYAFRSAESEQAGIEDAQRAAAAANFEAPERLDCNKDRSGFIRAGTEDFVPTLTPAAVSRRTLDESYTNPLHAELSMFGEGPSLSPAAKTTRRPASRASMANTLLSFSTFAPVTAVRKPHAGGARS